MSYQKEDIPRIITAQTAFFRSGEARSFSYRKEKLKRLKKVIKANDERVMDALKSDMNKPAFEAYTSEVGFVIQDIDHTLKWLKEWMRPEKRPTSIAHFPSSSRVYKEPLGKVLILAPWNYPFNLIFTPLVAAIAAGNTAFVKLPWQTPATAKVIDLIVREVFEPEEVVCLDIDDEDIIPSLIEQQRFDHIFFTGSTRVGKLIMRAAADHLTPVTLELGGKSPCIVDRTADLKVSARRIAWGKAYNAGQTCVAPDYLLVEERVKEEFLGLLEKEFEGIYGNGNQNENGNGNENENENVRASRGTPNGSSGSNDLTHIVNEKHFEMLEALLEKCELRSGGVRDKETLNMEMAIVEVDSLEHPLMQQEIFGPIMPVMGWTKESEIADIVRGNADPLAFYVYTGDKKFEKRMLQQFRFGGGCVNNSLVHLSNPDIPFGGIGASGMGRYHSRAGFDTFTHFKSVLKTATWLDVPVKYLPYSPWKMKAVKWLFG